MLQIYSNKNHFKIKIHIKLYTNRYSTIFLFNYFMNHKFIFIADMLTKICRYRSKGDLKFIDYKRYTSTYNVY